MSIGSAPSIGDNNLEVQKQKLAGLKQRFAGLDEQKKLVILKALLPQEVERIQSSTQAEWNENQENASEDDFFRDRSGWITPVSYSEILEGGQQDAELLKNLEKFEDLLSASGVEKKSWEVEVLEQVKDIKPSKNSTEKGKEWMVTHFMIERPDGSFEEVESTKIILKIKSKDGIDIEVPAFTVNHILDLHFKKKEAGSTFNTGSFEDVFKMIAESLPKQLPFKTSPTGDVEAAFEVDQGKEIGNEGITQKGQEMMERGTVTAEDLEILSTAKEEVFRLNIEGTDEEKKKFVEEFNTKLVGRNVRLGIRGTAITPFYTAEQPQTSLVFFAVRKEKNPDGSERNIVSTTAVGRHMEKLPTDRSFTTVVDLWKKLKAGEKLSSQEVSLIDAQKKAQECWWNGGFIVAPEKK